MAGKIHIEFISRGFRDILVGSTSGVLSDAAGRIQANAAAAGCDTTSHTWYGNYGGGRMVASVTTDGLEAAQAEADAGALSGAVHA